MKLTFLGTGTSTGVPAMLCHCPVCSSDDPRDKRLRASAMLTTDSGANILIDAGPDLRQQMLANPRFDRIDTLLVTHDHYDHVGGIDDLRPFAYRLDSDGRFPIHCETSVHEHLRLRCPWCFSADPYPGVPTFDVIPIVPQKLTRICGVDVTPVRVMHWRLPIAGFIFGNRQLAYITDCKTLPAETIDALRGVDTLVLNALRLEPHPAHLSLAEALQVVQEVKPRRAYFTHIAHTLGRHADVKLPPGVSLAYDNLVIEA